MSARSRSEGFHVRSLQAFGTFDHVELYLCALGKRAEATRLDRAEMYENVFPFRSRDEAKTFCIVEPLDGTGISHAASLLYESSLPVTRRIEADQQIAQVSRLATH
jgi:hypothetical protein